MDDVRIVKCKPGDKLLIWQNFTLKFSLVSAP